MKFKLLIKLSMININLNTYNLFVSARPSNIFKKITIKFTKNKYFNCVNLIKD